LCSYCELRLTHRPSALGGGRCFMYHARRINFFASAASPIPPCKRREKRGRGEREEEREGGGEGGEEGGEEGKHYWQLKFEYSAYCINHIASAIFLMGSNFSARERAKLLQT
jgi:hypothetical protein